MDINKNRRYPRVASDAQLELQHPALGVISLKAKNASKGGFFAMRGVHIMPPVDTEVRVTIKRHTGTLNTEPVNMRVALVCAQGIGLEFI